jgi:hypothetical protein
VRSAITRLFLLALATPCCAASHLDVVGANGRVRASDEPTEALQDAMLLDEAATDFGCPAAQVSVHAASGDRDVRVAEGCNARALYVVIRVRGEATRVPEHPGVRAVTATAVVRLSGDQRQATGQERHFLLTIGMRNTDIVDGGAERLGRYFALQAQGAHDLGCIPEQVIPTFEGNASPQTPVAEGCGKRATYNPVGGDGTYHVSSVVAVSSGMSRR